MTTSFLKNLGWRHATKLFDPSQPVSESQISQILKAVRMAPTSYGLQPFYVNVVVDPSIKEQLKKFGWDQPQFTTASFILVFITRNLSMQFLSTRINEYVSLALKNPDTNKESLKNYENLMRQKLGKFTEEELRVWAQKQAYIGLGFGLAACAELGIDSCPLEGLEPAEFDRILKLPPGDHTAVALAIGYKPPGYEPRHKVRFPDQDMFRGR